MTLHQARVLAEELVLLLLPYVERIEIAGSIRRKKDNPKDIEIVCIPKREPELDLFQNVIGQSPVHGFIKIVESMEKVKGEPTGKYTQRRYKGETVDLFMCVKENYGCCLMIRTGNAEFSHKMMIAANKRGYEQRDGFLTYDGKIIPVYEEIQYFEILGLPYLEPEQRTEEAYRNVKHYQH